MLLDVKSVGCPGPRDGGHALDRIAKELARREILHVQRVLAKTREIDRVGELRAVGAHVHHADRGVLVSLRERVHVEEHFFGRLHRARAPAVDGVLLPFDLALVVPEAAAPIRHGLVGLLDAREHLRVEALAERLQGPHHCGRIRVLRVEVRDDRGVVLLAQPRVVVDAALAELRGNARLARGDRRRGARVFGRGERVGMGAGEQHGGGYRDRTSTRVGEFRSEGVHFPHETVHEGEAKMIKIKLLAALVAGALAFPAYAQMQATGVDKRQANPEARAQKGARNGQLTPVAKKERKKAAKEKQDKRTKPAR
jgi:hypothetical protein